MLKLSHFIDVPEFFYKPLIAGSSGESNQLLQSDFSLDTRLFQNSTPHYIHIKTCLIELMKVLIREKQHLTIGHSLDKLKGNLPGIEAMIGTDKFILQTKLRGYFLPIFSHMKGPHKTGKDKSQLIAPFPFRDKKFLLFEFLINRHPGNSLFFLLRESDDAPDNFEETFHNFAINEKTMNKILILSALLSYCSVSGQSMEWPHHKKAVIVLTYDDALLSQLNTAIPQLRSAGFKATFFLTSDIDTLTIPKWRALAKKGFELANHTVLHPCSGTEDNPVNSDNYTPYQVVREVEIMNRFLFAIDGKTSRTFAYPCTETTVGGKDYVDTLRSYHLVKYGRIGGDTGAVITDFDHLDSLRVPSLGLEDSTPISVLTGFADSVLRRGGVGVIMFHGIGADYITTSAQVHQEFLEYLKKNKSSFWIPTFQEAMDYIMQHRNTGNRPPTHIIN